MRKPSTTTSRSAVNLWVREALAHAGMTHQQMADVLTSAGLGTYDRSIIQKMTTTRGVRMEEAVAIAEATGFPLPAPAAQPPHLERYARLTPEQRTLIDALVEQLLASNDKG